MGPNFAVALFCLASFLNYMNRYTTPPIVSRLKNAFNINDTPMGAVQSCFELVYVLSSPFYGFIGDRFSRTHIIATSLVFTSLLGFLSSFIPETSFGLLLITRSLLGVGEACCTNICPSIIGDMFVQKKRTLALTVFQFAIPLGCGLGFMSAGFVADWLDDWRWAFRITPIPMLMLAICLISPLVRDPQRGEAENVTTMHETTSYRQDLAYLSKIRSYTLSSLANVGAAFATGSLTFWAPDLILRMLTMKHDIHHHDESSIGFIFGIITIASGIFGVAMGAVISHFLLKKRFGLSADGLVCGFSMLLAAPIVYVGLIMVPIKVEATWVLMFFGTDFLSCCYVLLSEITLNVVIATRRATARSFQSTFSHLFGDAASPWLSGWISDKVRKHRMTFAAVLPDQADFQSMQTSLFLTTLIMAISGGLFLFGSLFINEDAEKSKQKSGRANKLSSRSDLTYQRFSSDSLFETSTFTEPGVNTNERTTTDN